MTRYAVDHARNTLIAHWSTGIGDIATAVAPLPPGQDVLRLAACLTDLSTACWRCYTHPASAADEQGPHSIGWHRQRERDAFATVVSFLTKPRRPASNSFTRVERAAHRVGRTLHTLRAPELVAYVATDVTAELTAVEQAELGDLSARAQQAVALSREDASPLQVIEADTLLHEHPFGAETLFTRIDPTAAAIAAAHWLYAAATTTARHTGLHPAQAITEVDRVKALAHGSLAEVLATMEAGASPRQAVMPMIRHALHVAEGHLLGVTEAKHRLTAAEDLINRVRADLDVGLDTVYLPITPLNPARPALDLLENLLHGIRSAWLLFSQYADSTGNRQTFLTEVRHEAALHRAHLL
ncbi:hypothetical protein [Nonomuraea sp. NPDC002799]